MCQMAFTPGNGVGANQLRTQLHTQLPARAGWKPPRKQATLAAPKAAGHKRHISPNPSRFGAVTCRAT